MDNAAYAGQLTAMGRQTAELYKNMSVVEEYFLDGRPVEPFQPWSAGQGSDRTGVNGGGPSGNEPVMD